MQARRSSARNQGLTLGSIIKAEADEVDLLAHALSKAAAPSPIIAVAAREAATASIHLHRIQITRQRVLNDFISAPPPPPKGPTTAALRAMMTIVKKGITPDTAGLMTKHGDQMGMFQGVGEMTPEQKAQARLLALHANPPPALRRLDEAERKALSRRTTLVRRLDYLMIEAERARIRSRRGEEPER